MRKTTLLFLLTAALLLPVVAHGQSIYSDTYVIPAAGHTAGANGALWMSDVAITNFSGSPLTVQLIFIETGENNTDNVFPVTSDTTPDGAVTVAANSSVLLRDLLNGYRGRQNSYGALILGGDKPFAVTSRAYNGGTGGNPIGQTVTPARDFFENSTGQSDNSAVVYLPGLVNNASTRSNIGFAAGTGSVATSPLGVQVTIKNASGQTLGTRFVTVAGGNFAHVQFSVSSISSTPFDIGSAEIRILQGAGTIVPYASVIDNASGNAAYIMGQFPASTPFTTSSKRSSIFRQLIDELSARADR